MIVSLTVVRYPKHFVPFALLAMAVHRLPLYFQQKCFFWKLMGTGKNGTFDLNPDWQQWALLAVWADEESFHQFNNQSFISKWWKLFTLERWTVLLKPLQAHGKWDGKEPFGKSNIQSYDGPVAALTRATIRFKKLKNFWSHVDEVAELMLKSEGYITSLGIGEAPVFRQATISFWQNMEDLKNFAYKSREHGEVIKKTRSENWYSEELFARFVPIKTFGNINGNDPLKSFIKEQDKENP